MIGVSVKDVEGSNINHFPRGNKKHQEEAKLGLSEFWTKTRSGYRQNASQTCCRFSKISLCYSILCAAESTKWNCYHSL